jgi:hypothetical protein
MKFGGVTSLRRLTALTWISELDKVQIVDASARQAFG